MDVHLQREYENVPIEDHDEAGSNTEVDESLMGDEKKWQEQDFQTRRKRPSLLKRILSVLRSGVNTLLLLVILGLLVVQQLRAAPTLEVGSDFTGFAPKFAPRITKFDMEYKYQRENTSEFFTDEVMHAWNDLMPSMLYLPGHNYKGDANPVSGGMGFQSVNDTTPYHDLPTPIEWPDQTVFTTSMTHQLHCLVCLISSNIAGKHLVN
jgi:hypothetical protein